MNLEEQVHAAKAYLLQTSSGESSNLFDHLTECLSKLLDERPNDALANFEEISRSVKREKLQPRPDVLQESQTLTSRAELALHQKPLFIPGEGDEADVEADEEVEIPFPNLIENMSYFEQGGVGIGKDETYRILLALKQLTKEFPLASVKFWGKIYGTKANYIIAEAEFQEGQGEEDDEEEGEEMKEEGEDNNEKGEEDDDEEERDEPPKSQWKPPPIIPKEDPKTGTNKKSYFVCNQPGDKWIKLPNVKPAEIVAARQIRKLFTGKLDSPVFSFPPFPGREENYLRAQIGRISATTHISPSGYYQFEDEEEEEPEEGEGPGPIEVNKEFEIGKLSEYADGSMNNWAHHIQYILPQGRCQWFNPIQKADDEFDEEEDEDEEKEQPDEPEPETGPQILTSVAEDAPVDSMPAWSARLSSNIIPQYAVAIVSSNLWPGAHAFATGKKFDNIYIGRGLKYSSTPYNPNLPPVVQEEFPAGADITETTDPTVEQEAALKAAQEEAEAAEQEEEEPEESDED